MLESNIAKKNSGVNKLVPNLSNITEIVSSICR